MTEDEIYDIVHDYVNQNISEEHFLEAKAVHPEIEWDALVREEQLIQSMFQAKVYDNLEGKISKDIDKIEHRKFVKKIAVASVLAMGVLMMGYFILRPDNELKKPKNDIGLTKKTKVEEVKVSNHIIDNEKIDSNTIENQVQQHKDVTLPKTVDEKSVDTQKEVKVSLTTKQDSIPQIESNDQSSLVKEMSPKDTQLIVDEEKKEERVENKEAQPVKVVEEKNIQEEILSPAKKNKLVTKNYIINPLMYDNLNILPFEHPVQLLVKSFDGQTVFDYSYNEFEPIVWEGKDVNENVLPSGLYIYQIYKDGVVIQFGQVTITK